MRRTSGAESRRRRDGGLKLPVGKRLRRVSVLRVAYTQGNAFVTPRYAAYNGSSTGFGSSVSHRRFCVVNIVLHDGAVSAVNYNGPTGGLLSQGEQCAYAVQNCVR